MQFAPNYTGHIGGLVRKYLPRSGQILELGSGDGTQTRRIVEPNPRVICIEQSASRRKVLSEAGYQVSNELSSHIGSDSSALFSLNCLEHIEDDVGALETINKCLMPGGLVVLYVPALPILFSSMDRRVGHYRRYTRKSLRKLLESTGFEVTSCEYVDSLGILPSLIYKVLPNASGEPTKSSVVFYDKFLFPMSRFLDLLFKKIAGKNILMIGVKK